MVAPLLMRSFVVVAGGTLRLVLPLYLNTRSSAIFTLVQACSPCMLTMALLAMAPPTIAPPTASPLPVAGGWLPEP